MKILLNPGNAGLMTLPASSSFSSTAVVRSMKIVSGAGEASTKARFKKLWPTLPGLDANTVLGNRSSSCCGVNDPSLTRDLR